MFYLVEANFEHNVASLSFDTGSGWLPGQEVQIGAF